MNKSTKTVAITGIAIALFGILIYIYIKNALPKYRWDQNYTWNNDQPYGLKLFYELLSGSGPKQNFVHIDRSPDQFLKNKDTASLYVFIGAKYVIDSVTSGTLINFVKRGNVAIISSLHSEHYLFEMLTNHEHPILYYYYYNDSVAKVTFPDKQWDSSFTFVYRYEDKPHLYPWKGFDEKLINDTLKTYHFEKVSSLNGRSIDCFRVKCGKGWFLFHYNPIFFTNFFLSKEQGLNYVNTLLSDYRGTKIYWDEFSKTFLTSNDMNTTESESPLRFILSERSLRWSWYMLCVFLVLFVLFNAKRKQAYIPLLPVNKNTTVEYIRAIASLHYQNNSLEFLADEIMKQFQTFVKRRYNVPAHLDKKEMARQLAPLSGIPEETILKLYSYYLDVKYIPETNDLIELYRLTEYFYQKCK